MQTRQITREAIGIIAVGASFFLLASLFSFNVGDDITRVFPVNERVSNLGGMTGFNAAHTLFSAFGVLGGYVTGALICLFSFSFLTHRDPTKGLVQGVLGSVTLILTASVIERLLIGTRLPVVGLVSEDLGGRLAGGYWGIFIETWVSRSFSNLALLALVAAGLGTGLAMAMEYFQELWTPSDDELVSNEAEANAQAEYSFVGVEQGSAPVNTSIQDKIFVAPSRLSAPTPVQNSEEDTVDIPLNTVTVTPNSTREPLLDFEITSESQDIDQQVSDEIGEPENAEADQETWLDKAHSFLAGVFSTEDEQEADSAAPRAQSDKQESEDSNGDDPVNSVLSSVFDAEIEDPLAGMPTTLVAETTIASESSKVEADSTEQAVRIESTKVKRDALEAFFDDSQALKAIFNAGEQGSENQEPENSDDDANQPEPELKSDKETTAKQSTQLIDDEDLDEDEDFDDEADSNGAEDDLDDDDCAEDEDIEEDEDDSARWDLSAIAAGKSFKKGSSRSKASSSRAKSQESESESGMGSVDNKVVVKRAPWQTPSMDLLEMPEQSDDSSVRAEVEAKASLIEECLKEFRIEAKVEHIERGPNVTLYALALGKGIKVQRISALLDNLALVLAAPGAIRLQAPIRGTSWVGLEVPNEKQELVSFAEIYRQPGWRDEQLHLPIFLGKDTAGRPLVADLAKLPHLLVAGATGSGKSVCINTMILSLLMTRSPEEVKLILIDPKQVELAPFSEIPHLLSPVVTDMRHAGAALDWAVQKMEERYNFLARARVRHLREYNKLGKAGLVERLGLESEEDLVREGIPWKLPYIVVVVDELNDLMMVAQKEVEASIMRLAQKSRAIGIHVILATQRPSVDVITGVIKSNLPARLAFQVTSKVDSRTILDVMGAEKLLGMGDMLFLAPGRSQPIRAKGAYVSENEMDRVLKTLCAQREPEFASDLVALKDAPPPEKSKKKKKKGRSKNRDENGMDELFEDAVEVVLSAKRGSVSLIQRKLGVGYARAARMIEAMSERGILGGERGSRARKVLMSMAQWEDVQDEMD